MRRIGLVLAAAALPLLAQPDRVVVRLTDPSQPAQLRVTLVNGTISVKGYNGDEIVVITESGGRSRRQTAKETEGLRRITTNVGIEEENNVVRISGPVMRLTNIQIQVPVRTSVRLNSVNGNISVEGIDGEINAETINGTVTLTDISGAAVAHALNGAVLSKFSRVAPNKPMAFSSLNGKIDVTLPPDVKCDVKVKTDRGELYSDFDIVAKASPEANRSREGKDEVKVNKYRVKIDRLFYGSINGGGPEYQFSNMNGNIYLRKAQGPAK
ncbi:MAG: DUF4097 family beta strand repeat-containing protein [bacterium]|jgi:DUF4097 and DUF4098 domain-containing protein YvlB